MQCLSLASQRLPQKLYQIVNGRRLIEHGLCLIKSLDMIDDDKLIFCTADLVEDVKQHNLPYYVISGGTMFPSIVAKYQHILDRYDTIIDANFCCRPFLKQATAQRIVEAGFITQTSLVVTQKKRTILFENQECILGKGRLSDTKTNPEVEEVANLAYIYKAPDYYNPDLIKPFPLRLSPEEQIDIDTMTDLEYARRINHETNESELYRTRNGAIVI